MDKLSQCQSRIMSKFCDHYEPLFCNDEAIATEIYMGNLPEGATLKDIRAVMSDIKNALARNSAAIYHLRSIDDQQAASPSISFLIDKTIRSVYVQALVEVENIGDPDDDDDKVFNFNICYNTRR